MGLPQNLVIARVFIREREIQQINRNVLVYQYAMHIDTSITSTMCNLQVLLYVHMKCDGKNISNLK